MLHRINFEKKKIRKSFASNIQKYLRLSFAEINNTLFSKTREKDENHLVQSHTRSNHKKINELYFMHAKFCNFNTLINNMKILPRSVYNRN